MQSNSETSKKDRSMPDWLKNIKKFEKPHLGKAIFQILNSIIPYVALWWLMIQSIQRGYSYFATLALAVIAGAFLVRIFTLFHDCCHNSFFASRKANRFLGNILGIVTFTSFSDWQYAHAMHHATSGNLDKRGMGDVWTMTVEEFLASPKWKRITYRFFRNPIVMFGFGPAYLFFVSQRFASKGARKKDRRLNVIFTNISLLVVTIIMSYAIGFWTYVFIQIPVLIVAGVMGVWLFYVQHQFDGVYWGRDENLDKMKALMEGSSYYKLPKVFQWITGNIGLHHIHHVRAIIPNYNLQKCYNSIPELQEVKPLTIRKSLKSLFLNLWDEKDQKLVSFWSLRKGTSR